MFLKEFFYFQRSDRRAILFVLTLITIATVSIWWLADYDKSNEMQADDASAGHASAMADIHDDNVGDNTARHVETFAFDPNTADSTQLRRLGLQQWQIRNIYKYRAKGGVYRCKEDFAYVYGLTAKDYRRLAPYIRIGTDFQPASSLPEVRRHRAGYPHYAQDGNTHIAIADDNGSMAQEPTKRYSPKIHKGEYISVNSADTTDLMKIPGIGSYYSKAILRYRSQLGGFVSKKQLLEIDNFPEEAIEYMSIGNEAIRKINVNRMTIAQMRRHPYINYYQARAIADYRRLHGAIRDIRELRMMQEFSEADLKRIEPYLEY